MSYVRHSEWPQRSSALFPVDLAKDDPSSPPKRGDREIVFRITASLSVFALVSLEMFICSGELLLKCDGVMSSSIGGVWELHYFELSSTHELRWRASRE